MSASFESSFRSFWWLQFSEVGVSVAKKGRGSGEDRKAASGGINSIYSFCYGLVLNQHESFIAKVAGDFNP
jgi:hypothetical protein